MKSKSVYDIYFYYVRVVFCLSYFTLKKLIINTVTCYIQWAVLPVMVFSFHWLGKREFGQFTNSIPGGPASPPPPLYGLESGKMLLHDFGFEYHQKGICSWRQHSFSICRRACSIRNNNRFPLNLPYPSAIMQKSCK